MIVLLPLFVEQELSSSIFQMDPLRVEGGINIPRNRIISCLKACKIISKGCLYHIVRVKFLTPKFLPLSRSP